MNGHNDLNRDVDIDLGGMFAGIWRNKLRLLLVSLLVTALVFLLLQAISPRYRSESSILIRQSDPVLSRTSAAPTANFDNQSIASQVQLLRSESIARTIVQGLDARYLAEFDPANDKSILVSLLEIIGLADSNSGVSSQDRVLETYFERLKVYQAEGSRVIVIQFWSKDPELAALIPNRVTEEYLKLQAGMKRGLDPLAFENLAPELETMKDNVKRAETDVAAFRADNNLLESNDDKPLVGQELSELATELGRVRSRLSRAEANASAVRSAVKSGTLDRSTSVLKSPLIQRLREKQINLQSELAELSIALLPAHPKLRRVQSQIDIVSNQIRSEARKIQSSLQQEAAVARTSETDLLQRRNELKKEAERVGKARVELQSLQLEAKAQQSLLSDFLVQYKEAKARQNRKFVAADAYVFAKAQIQSKPYFPRKLPILAATFAGTLLMGAMLTLATGILTGGASAPSVRKMEPDFNQAVTQAVVAEPIVTQQVAPQPITTQPPVVQPTIVQPSFVRPAAEQPIVAPAQTPRWETKVEKAPVAPEPVEAESEEQALAAVMRDFEQEVQAVTGERASPLRPNHLQQVNEEQPVAAAASRPMETTIAPETAGTHSSAANSFIEPAPAGSFVLTEPLDVHNVRSMAEAIEGLETSRLAILSPEGDLGSASIVMLARRLADDVGDAVLVDLSRSAASTRATLANATVTTLNAVFSDDASFVDAIHSDHLSQLHVIPGGRDNPNAGPPDAIELAGILEALQNNYTHVIVDCGADFATAFEPVARGSLLHLVAVTDSLGSAAHSAKEMLEGAGFENTFLFGADEIDRKSAFHLAA